MDDLLSETCVEWPKGSPGLSPEAIAGLMPALHSDWRAEGDRLIRRFERKGYRPVVMLVNAVAFLAEREGHHPDIAFGWGWCEVRFWTHTVGGLSRNDFICAAKLDALVGG